MPRPLYSAIIVNCFEQQFLKCFQFNSFAMFFRVKKHIKNTSSVAELESRTQDSRPRTQKNPRPRPRTALPRTHTLEAKDRNARGQGQGHKRKRAQKKKNLKKNFFGRFQKKRRRKKFFADLQNFNHSKNSAVLEPRTGQFSRT